MVCTIWKFFQWKGPFRFISHRKSRVFHRGTWQLREKAKHYSDISSILVKTRKEEYLLLYSIFPKIFLWEWPFHLNFHRRNWFLRTNEKRSTDLDTWVITLVRGGAGGKASRYLFFCPHSGAWISWRNTASKPVAYDDIIVIYIISRAHVEGLNKFQVQSSKSVCLFAIYLDYKASLKSWKNFSP